MHIRTVSFQLKELIIQNYNHPSICFWGISNEILIGGISEQLVENHKELNALDERNGSNPSERRSRYVSMTTDRRTNAWDYRSWKATTIISDGMAGKWKTMVRGWTTSIKFIR